MAKLYVKSIYITLPVRLGFDNQKVRLPLDEMLEVPIDYKTGIASPVFTCTAFGLEIAVGFELDIRTGALVTSGMVSSPGSVVRHYVTAEVEVTGY